MKKLLYLYLALQIFSSIVNFIVLLQASFIYAIIITAVNLLGIVIPIAILKNMDNIDEMKSEIYWLRSDLRRLERDVNGEKGSDGESSSLPAANEGEIAIGNWKCIKCGTVNKAGSSHCSNCKAAYSSLDNPTDDPSKPKKLNRWGI